VDVIKIKGANEHNLKDISLDLPREKLVVITGISGSGKSSLAFDTIYAEGQRRYVESLSAYARQFLEQNKKPDVESIDGLSPAISIEQKTSSRNPRSTVATLTEIYDYLRLLFARAASPYCYVCNAPIVAQTVQQIVDQVLEYDLGTKFFVLAPLIRDRKGEYRKELEDLSREGFARVRIDGEMFELDEDIVLDKKKKHSIDVVVDRLVMKEGLKGRLTDSVETALRKADGLVTIAPLNAKEQLFSERFACHACGVSYPEIEPRMFSFNSPHGACSSCDGLGIAMEFDPDKVIPDSSVSLANGAVKPWAGRFKGMYRQQLRCVAEHFNFSLEVPFKKLSKKHQKIVLWGSGKVDIQFNYGMRKSSYHIHRPFEGVLPHLLRSFNESSSERVRENLQDFMAAMPCYDCHGKRLRAESLAILLDKKSIADVCAMSVTQAHQFFSKLKLGARQKKIAKPILREIDERLGFMEAVGLNYIGLDRTSATLSGGESQRIRLATQIGSALRGVIYVLDEPSIGLHQRDNDRLLKTLERLRDLGNTVLVVEHDEDTIRRADWIVDLGPGAGRYGGKVVAEGSLAEILAKKTLTSDYLNGTKTIAIPEVRREGNGHCIEVLGAKGNNLKNIDVRFPLGQFICVSGVSGSGKSTLVNDTLYKAVANALHHTKDLPASHGEIRGTEHIDKIINIDQSPIGRTPRSNPATYTGLFTHVRDLFAHLPESRVRGYKPGRFSFNVKGGRCEACEGDGILRIEMHFLPDVFVTCETCKGHRYNRETLEILYRGKSIADVLKMTVDEASGFFSVIPAIARKLETLEAVGLGYIHLGQAATTFSGGEAQRIKLSRELSKRSTGRTLYILDEPTTGLHFHDIERLMGVLERLVDSGNTIVVIEHNLDVIKTADTIIDLGPEGGSGGGEVLAAGRPEEVAAEKRSYTGRYLKNILKRRRQRRAQSA
jgi:excinuclease ABC subunit A